MQKMPLLSVYSKCIGIVLCLFGVLWPVVKGDGVSCVCERHEEICKCSESYVTKSEFSDFKADFNRKRYAQVLQLVERIEVLEETIKKDENSILALTTEIRNLSQMLIQLQKENKWLKQQLSERNRRSVIDGSQLFDGEFGPTENQDDSWLNGRNLTGTDVDFLEKAIEILGEEKLHELAHSAEKYTIEIIELNVFNSKGKRIPEKSKISVSLKTLNDQGIPQVKVLTGEEILHYLQNMTYLFNDKIQELEERLMIAENLTDSLLSLKLPSMEDDWLFWRGEISDAVADLNSSVITYEALEELIRDVTGDILRSNTTFIGINATEKVAGLTLDTQKKLFLSMLEQGADRGLAIVGFDHGFYVKSNTSNQRLLPLIEVAKLLLGSSVINVRADMESVMTISTKNVEDDFARQTAELRKQVNILSAAMMELIANESILQEKYNKDVKAFTEEVDLLSKRADSQLNETEQFIEDTITNITKYVEEKCRIFVHNGTSTNVVLEDRDEVRNASERIDQIAKNTSNFMHTMEDMQTLVEVLLNTTESLAEEMESLKPKLDDTLSIVNDLQLNHTAFYASLSDVERLQKATNELDTKLNDIRGHMHSLQERVSKNEMEYLDLKVWKNEKAYQFETNSTQLETETKQTKHILQQDSHKYCSSIIIEDPNLNVSDGESFFAFTSENERNLTDLPVGSILHFFCQPIGKYEIIGQNILTCGRNGEWDNDYLPVCRKLRDGRFLKALIKKEKCPEPYGLFPHPKSCSKFYNCRNGVAYERTCDPGLYFDPEQLCTHPQYTECNSGKRPVRKETPAILFDPPIGSPNSGLSVNAKGQVVAVPGKDIGIYCAFPRKWGKPIWVTPATYSRFPLVGAWKSAGGNQATEYGIVITEVDREHSGNYTCVTPTGTQQTIEIVVGDSPILGCDALPVYTREGLAAIPDKAAYEEGEAVKFACKKGYKRKSPFISRTKCVKGKWTIHLSDLPYCINPRRASRIFTD